jgi:hypothetical protein
MDTIDSIPGQELSVPVHINIACDGDLVTYNKIRHNKRIYNLIFTSEQRGAVYCRNELSKDCISTVVYATDDIIFSPGAIKEALKMMYDKFPDDDGVVGFCQIGNRKFSKSGVAMIGEKFMKRFPDKKIFYPKYFHFAAQEIKALAEKYGKFAFCETAIVKHLNPFINNQYMDSTHADARIHKEEDHRMSDARKKAGEIWGDDA